MQWFDAQLDQNILDGIYYVCFTSGNTPEFDPCAA